MGCQDTMPTLLEWPSKTTTGSDRGVSSPFSGICQTLDTEDTLNTQVKEPIQPLGEGVRSDQGRSLSSP